MGMQCELKEAFSFIYKADVMQGLVEHEFDHVFIGTSDDLPIINKDEVESFRYDTVENIKADIERNPQNYTAWFKIAFDKLLETL